MRSFFVCNSFSLKSHQIKSFFVFTIFLSFWSYIFPFTFFFPEWSFFRPWFGTVAEKIPRITSFTLSIFNRIGWKRKFRSSNEMKCEMDLFRDPTREKNRFLSQYKTTKTTICAVFYANPSLWWAISNLIERIESEYATREKKAIQHLLP